MEPITEYKHRGVLHHFDGYWMDLETQRVWSEKVQRWLKSWKDRNGYFTLYLTDTNGKQLVGIKLSRLVWTVYHGKQIPDGYQVNHIDENKENNAPSNLNLMTAMENSNHGTRNARVAAALRGKKKTPEHVARMAAAHRGRKLSPEHVARVAAALTNGKLSKAVAQLTLDGNLVRTWPSTAEAGRNGWNASNVAACCRKCYHRQGNDVYKGYRWMWMDDYQAAPVAETDGQLFLNF